MQFGTQFLVDILKRLQFYKELGDKCFQQLNDTDILYQPNQESNSIAIIVQHIHGNMLSRFTNFLTEDGEKEWRKRDEEFESKITSKASMIQIWEEGWSVVLNTISSLQPDDLMKEVTIRSEKLFAFDAILRQLAHYAYHIGQIVYIAKAIQNEQWQSLSIPKKK